MSTPKADSVPGSTPDPESGNPGPVKPPRRIARTVGIVLLSGLILGAVSIGGAEYYTSRPDFCGTCHIMDPYYESWSQDKHGAKLDVWCVECHYAPGEQHTIKAKFKGLSQLASYFSGRYGAGRPRAHVDDASCMRSKCHGDGEHLDKMLLIGEPRKEKRLVSGHETEITRSPTVRFVHSKHIGEDARLKEIEKEIAQVASRLREKLSPEDYAKVEAASRSVKPAVERETEIRSLLDQLGAPHLADDATLLMRQEHTRLRLSQLEGLNCSACHTYDATSKNHFAVDQQTCFVCHFTNQSFNRDTGECLKCHEPPTRKIAVHSMPPQESRLAGMPDTAPATAALMDHMDIVNRGIDCASCHMDVIQGAATVTARECTHCHDQQRFLVDFDRRNTEIVAEYHRVHVANQRARCSDCHRSVQHKLIDAMHVGTSQDFLAPVINDCQHCHPSHHREQVQLLMGTGGEGAAVDMPNAMFGSRLNCRACHTQSGSDFKGDPLVQATQATCVACHGEDYRKLFDQWVNEIDSSVKEVEASLARVETRIKELREAGQTISPEVEHRVGQARSNLHFVKSGNGIHNKNYALQLLDISLRDLDASMAALSPQ